MTQPSGPGEAADDPYATPTAPPPPHVPPPPPGYGGPPPGYGAPSQGGYPPNYPPPYGYAPQYGQPPYPQPRSTNGFAIASLVCGVIGVSILALVFGYIARRQIREQGQSGDGMAIAGIVLGWIGVAFGLVAILFIASMITSHPGMTINSP